MDDRRRTFGAVFILVTVFLVLIAGIFLAATRQNPVSPVPEEDAVRIIFITPTPGS